MRKEIKNITVTHLDSYNCKDVEGKNLTQMSKGFSTGFFYVGTSQSPLWSRAQGSTSLKMLRTIELSSLDSEVQKFKGKRLSLWQEVACHELNSILSKSQCEVAALA